MTWAQWALLFHGSQAGVAALSLQLNPANNTAEAIFSALCDHGRANLTYRTDNIGLAAGLQSRTINCQSASDLLIGLYLHRNQGVDAVAHSFGVHGGNVPVVTPQIAQAGVRIQNNLRDGGGRMFFTGGHSITAIGGDKLDLITGLSGQNIHNQFRPATRGPLVAGQPTFQCMVNGVPRTFSRLQGTTGNGLSEFRVTPPIQ